MSSLGRQCQADYGKSGSKQHSQRLPRHSSTRHGFIAIEIAHGNPPHDIRQANIGLFTSARKMGHAWEMRWPFPVALVTRSRRARAAPRKEQMESSQLKRRKTIFAASDEVYSA